MYNIALYPKFRAFDSSGSPLAGGLVYTYEKGTSTPKAAYSDNDLTVEQTNPVVLDSEGQADIYLDGYYKFIIKDSEGTTIETNDDVQPLWHGGTPPEALEADRAYYVRTDGSDSNDGLSNSGSGAFLTIQKALDVVKNTVNLNGYNVTIMVGNGTYTAGGSVIGPFIGNGAVGVLGDLSTPSNVSVSVTGGDCFSLEKGASLLVSGLKLSTTTSGSCLRCYTNSNLAATSNDFGACASSHIEVGQSSYVGIAGNYEITGGAVSHYHVGSEGTLAITSGTVTLTGVPSFSAYFAGVKKGEMTCKSTTFSGTATGYRFVVHKGGLIDVGANSTTYFPGNVAGLINSGGVYYSDTSTMQLTPTNGNGNEAVMYSRNFNAQTFNEHFKTTSEALAGYGYFYTNGDDCYSSGETHFAGDSQVLGNSGTADGWTFSKKSDVAANSPVFNTSTTSSTVGYIRRQGTDGDVLTFYKGSSNVGSISVTTTNTAYNTTSDRRAKQNISDITNPCEILKLLKPCEYEFIVDPENRVTGFIADELQQVFPSAVTGEVNAYDEEGNPIYQGVDPGKLIAVLTAALQDAVARIEALEGG